MSTKREELNQVILFYKIVPPVCFCLGLLGNIMGYVVLLNRKLVKIGSRNIYRYLFIADSMFITQMLIDMIAYSLGYDVTLLSTISCKTYYYFSYTLATISPMLLVYISIERFVSIKYPAERMVLRTNRNQFIFLVFIIFFNLTFYLPFIFNFQFKIHSLNNFTNHYECDFIDIQREKILTLMDLFNRVIVPSLLILVSTVMVLHSIFKSRNRVYKNYTSAENRVFKRDLRLAFTSIFLNIFYMVLTLPLPILLIFGKDYSEMAFHITFGMFYFSYATNFYIIYVSNSLFRNQFLNMFRRINKEPATMSNAPARRSVKRSRIANDMPLSRLSFEHSLNLNNPLEKTHNLVIFDSTMYSNSTSL